MLAVLKVMRPVLLLHMWAWPHATALWLLLPAPKAFTAASPAGPASPAFHASSAAHASPVCKAAAAAAAAVKPVLLKVVVRAPLRPVVKFLWIAVAVLMALHPVVPLPLALPVTPCLLVKPGPVPMPVPVSLPRACPMALSMPLVPRLPSLLLL